MRIFSIAWGGVSKQRLWSLVLEQRNLLDVQRAHISALELQYARNVRDLISNFRLALENEDDDALRDGLGLALSDLNDHVARLEEHSGI
jgi:hypothetical protein